MFCSLCSLRSTHCAALIALAAAAGISRFEPVDDGGREKRQEGNRPVSEARVTGCAKPTFFQLSMDRPSPWAEPLTAMVAWCLSAADDNSANEDEATSGLSCWFEAPSTASEFAAPIALSAIEHFALKIRAPSARQHQFPYAIGPPARGCKTPLRADGTFVPGDSAARRSLRVAASFAVSLARIARHWVSGPEFAGSIFLPLPSVALRGQPEISSRQRLGLSAFAWLRHRATQAQKKMHRTRRAQSRAAGVPIEFVPSYP